MKVRPLWAPAFLLSGLANSDIGSLEGNLPVKAFEEMKRQFLESSMPELLRGTFQRRQRSPDYTQLSSIGITIRSTDNLV